MLLHAPRAPHSRRRKTSKAVADGSAAGRFASAAKGESRRLPLPVLNDPPIFRTVPPGTTSMFWRRKKVRDRSQELQSEFLKNLNHHIRNPLNAIVLLTDLLIQTVRADEEEIHSALLTIARASKQLERNLRSILDLYKMETGAFALAPATVKVAELITGKLSEIRGTAERRGIKLVFENETPEITVMVDRYCLEQALENLFHNALSYTEQGQITARLCVSRRQASASTLKIPGLESTQRICRSCLKSFSRGKTANPTVRVWGWRRQNATLSSMRRVVG